MALAVWTGLFAHLPPHSFAAGAAKSGVAPAALGVGYAAFFLYSALVGAAAVVLTLIVGRSQQGRERRPAVDPG